MDFETLKANRKAQVSEENRVKWEATKKEALEWFNAIMGDSLKAAVEILVIDKDTVEVRYDRHAPIEVRRKMTSKTTYKDGRGIGVSYSYVFSATRTPFPSDEHTVFADALIEAGEMYEEWKRDEDRRNAPWWKFWA